MHKFRRMGANALFAVGMLGLAAGAASAQTAERLLVADTAAAKIHVYDAGTLHLLGTLDHVVVGAHAGTTALPDGRVLIPDEASKQLLVLQVAGTVPTVVARVPMPIPLGVRYGWMAVDPAGAYALVTSDDAEEAIDYLTVVDLTNYTSKQVKVDIKGAPNAEFHATIGGDPPVAILHLANRVETYPLSRLMDASVTLGSLRSGSVKLLDTFTVGEGGHSNSYSPQAKKWAGSTLRGLEVATFSGNTVTATKLLPWDADGLSGGRNARQRLTSDGQHVFGPLNAPVAPEDWASTQVDLHWADLTNDTVKRVPLAKGLVGRGGVSSRYAVYSNVHPDGDYASLVDVDPASASFRQVVGRVPLAKLANAPAAGKPAAGAESRYSAISTDGKTAFVSHGGDGIVSVIDTERRTIQQLRTPSPLRGGGYLTVVQVGAPLFDVVAR